MGALLAGQVSLAGAATIHRGVWLDVPYVHQQPEGCGAACISMVMQYWMRRVGGINSADAVAVRIQRQLYNPRAGGIIARDMERYFRAKGFETFAFRGEWNDLDHHLRKGRPLIVSLKTGQFETSLHYVVVAGTDDGEGVVLVNDPARRKLLKLDRSKFEEQWRDMDCWTLLALPGRRP